MFELHFRKAHFDDIERLIQLINAAYRTQSGRSWTTEQSFIVGERISREQLKLQLQQPHFELWVGTVEQDQIIACIGLTFEQDQVEIGTFAIDPAVQNSGLGRQMLEYAERYTFQKYPSLSYLSMYVLNVRAELIAYYERRGYQQTGQLLPYPVDAQVGQPLVPIQLVEMRKPISSI